MWSQSVVSRIRVDPRGAATLARSTIVLFAEPPRTPYDIRFSIAGVPVRVHPLFWLVALLLGANAIRDGIELLSWMTAVFVSILIHELGHAMAIRYYGWQPSITLHQLGGLTSYNPRFTASAASYRRAGNTPLAQIIISAAGPAAGFLFMGAILAGLFASGQYIDWLFGLRFARVTRSHRTSTVCSGTCCP